MLLFDGLPRVKQEYLKGIARVCHESVQPASQLDQQPLQPEAWE